MVQESVMSEPRACVSVKIPGNSDIVWNEGDKELLYFFILMIGITYIMFPEQFVAMSWNVGKKLWNLEPYHQTYFTH